ncbi:hypothetical protein GCM10010502_58290 [Kitasatospora aureofaciens]|uniref:Uncharacterized protein n=1 Tax=Kitasatospora aureofaciens TaxID=1894 RepID=A0A8H9HYQ9_KITAU|nr:hypothetical protein GCM10010502_58290 [Kitasatospora aureofaciens]
MSPSGAALSRHCPDSVTSKGTRPATPLAPPLVSPHRNPQRRLPTPDTEALPDNAGKGSAPTPSPPGP